MFSPFLTNFFVPMVMYSGLLVAQQLRCFPLGQRKKSVCNKIAHPITAQLKGQLCAKRVLESLIYIAVLESSFFTRNQKSATSNFGVPSRYALINEMLVHLGLLREDILHEEIMSNTITLISVMIEEFPETAEKVILSTKFSFSGVECTGVVLQLLDLLLHYPVQAIRVKLATSFTTFAAISPRTFHAVLRQSLDSLIDLNIFASEKSINSGKGSETLASKMTQFFEMSKSLAHSFLGKSTISTDCNEYFDYIPKLIEKLGIEMKLNTSSQTCKLNQDLNFVSSRTKPHSQEIVAGFLSLIKVLVSSSYKSDGKNKIHKSKIQPTKDDIMDALMTCILKQALFTEDFSQNIQCMQDGKFLAANSSKPLCTDATTRKEAFGILLEIVSQSPNRLLRLIRDLQPHLSIPKRMTKQRLLSSYNGNNTQQQHVRASRFLASQFQRSSAGLVGLTNQGLTCYMNATLQQLFFLQHLRHNILNADLGSYSILDSPTASNTKGNEDSGTISIPNIQDFIRRATYYVQNSVRQHENDMNDTDDMSEDVADHDSIHMDSTKNARNENKVKDKHDIVRQLQRTLLFLQESHVHHFDPAVLVSACTELPLEYGVYAQNDARDFMDQLLDQCESTFKEKKQNAALQAIKWHFNGKSANENIRSCGHNSSSAQAFYLLEVVIKGCENLTDALKKMVAGEQMIGDNRLSCESCDSKVDATRRFCIEQLPNTLVLQLKRFDLDFTVFQLYKLNSKLEFPFEEYLDMYPYTREGLRELDKVNSEGQSGENNQQDQVDITNNDNNDVRSDENKKNRQKKRQELYRLRGVVIHMGEAGGGHYYSLIRTDSGEWCKFDDEQVDPFDLKDFASECFGGSEIFIHDHGGQKLPRQRDIPQNAYMLFYERVNPKQLIKNEEKKVNDDAVSHIRDSMNTTKVSTAGAEYRVDDTAEKAEFPMISKNRPTAHTVFGPEIWKDNYEAARCLLLLDPSLSDMLFELFNNIMSAQKASKFVVGASLDNNGILTQFFVSSVVYVVEVTFRLSIVKGSDIRAKWERLLVDFLIIFSKIIHDFRDALLRYPKSNELANTEKCSHMNSTTFDSKIALQFLKWLLVKSIVHPSRYVRLIATSVVRVLVLHKDTKNNRIDSVYGNKWIQQRGQAAEIMMQEVVKLLPILQLYHGSCGQELVELVGDVVELNKEYFCEQCSTQGACRIDAAAIWLHFLCGGDSPLLRLQKHPNENTARTVKANDKVNGIDAPVSVSTVVDLQIEKPQSRCSATEDQTSYNIRVANSNSTIVPVCAIAANDDESSGDNDYVPDSASTSDAEFDVDESTNVSLDTGGEINKLSNVRLLDSMKSIRKNEECASSVDSPIIAHKLPSLLSWKNCKEDNINLETISLMMEQLMHWLDVDKIAINGSSNIDSRSLNTDCAKGNKEQKSGKTVLLTTAVQACLRSPCLWLNWILSFPCPAFFVKYIEFACANNAWMSKQVMTYMMSNLDERGHQKDYCIRAFQSLPIVLYGEDILINVLAIEYDSAELVQDRHDFIFSSSSDGTTSFLARIDGWMRNAASNDSEACRNATEVRIILDFIRICHLLFMKYDRHRKNDLSFSILYLNLSFLRSSNFVTQ